MRISDWSSDVCSSDLATVALDAEADVRPAAGQREGPGVARQQVGLEPDEQLCGGAGADVCEVLPEGVPLAEVAGGAHAEVLAHRRPHPVGGDGVARGELTPVGDVAPDPGAPPAGAGGGRTEERRDGK